MALPTIEAPKYEVKIPSTGKRIQYRPYLVKEEKILMIASESEDQTQIMTAVKDVIRACTYEKVDPDKLTTFDLEYIFLKLRAKSVGETSKVSIKCEKCEKPTVVEINIDAIEIDMSGRNSASKIQLTDKIGVNMTYPSMKAAARAAENIEKDKINSAMDVVISCVDSIFDEKKVYPASESSRDELIAFIESLNQTQFGKIQEFIQEMPKLKHTVDFTCSNKDCKCANSITLEGMANFF